MYKLIETSAGAEQLYQLSSAPFEDTDLVETGTAPTDVIDDLQFLANQIRQESNTFVMIHFEAGYKGRLENNLPIDIPAEYMTMDLGWQEYLFKTAEKLVQKADGYGFHLTNSHNRSV